MLLKGADSDAFPLKSQLGKLLYAALDEDDELVIANRAVGKEHKAQQLFRKVWAQKGFKAVQEQLMHTTSSCDLTTQQGKPCNFAQLVWELKKASQRLPIMQRRR